MHPLLDPHLLFIAAVAGAVSLLTTLNVAARPAAIRTGSVALAFTISSLFFMLTRFANLFYAPLMGAFVDRATRTGNHALLYEQMQVVVVGASVGALMSWVLLPTFVELYARGIRSMERHQSMLKVLSRLLYPSGWITLLGAPRPPSMMGVRLFAVEGIPWDFLVVNVAATAIWTAGALCALLASAREPEYKTTALLLSGLVNAFAAIAFSIFVDPKAAVITDQAKQGERPAEHVTIASVHLAAGNFLGAGLALCVLSPGTAVIEWAARAIGQQGGALAGSLLLVAAINMLVTVLASTTYVSRISAVITSRVATAIAVYNVFYLITRLAQQVYAPLLGAISDHAVKAHRLDLLEQDFRVVIGGASVGVFLGWLLMPTFVEIYNRAIRSLDRTGSVPGVLLEALRPRSWGAVFRCLRRPSMMGVSLADLRSLPSGFLVGNVLVISIYTIGVMAAIFAGAQLSASLSRTATLLSSVVNGVATITLSLVVDPTTALITDQCDAGRRPVRHIYAMAVFLVVGQLIGTMLSQLIFWPATHVIMSGAELIGHFFQR